MLPDRRELESLAVLFPRFRLAALALVQISALCGLLVPSAVAGVEEAVKAIQAGDAATGEKELQVLVKERDPRAQFLLGFYIYGNPESKLFDLAKAAPLLLDAAERGYIAAAIPLAGIYAEGKGMPKSFPEAYKWVTVAERWNVPNASQLLEQLGREMKPDEIEKAKAAGLAFTFKTK